MEGFFSPAFLCGLMCDLQHSLRLGGGNVGERGEGGGGGGQFSVGTVVLYKEEKT